MTTDNQQPSNPITSISKVVNFFRNPPQPGEVLDHKGVTYLILGIENFRVTQKSLIIAYTCQPLDDNGMNFPKKGIPYSPYTMLQSRFKFDGGGQKMLQLGGLTQVNGKTYKMMEYVRVYLNGTDIHVDILGKEIAPMDSATLKKKRLQNRMEVMKFGVVEFNREE